MAAHRRLDGGGGRVVGGSASPCKAVREKGKSERHGRVRELERGDTARGRKGGWRRCVV